MDIEQRIAIRAFIVKNGKVLIIRESQKYKNGSQKGLYDFPGGKIRPGETYQKTIDREVYEEIGIKVNIKNPFYVDEWYPVVKNGELQIIGIFFECTVGDEEIKLSEDHDDYMWMDIEKYKQYNLVKENISACEAYLNLCSK